MNTRFFFPLAGAWPEKCALRLLAFILALFLCACSPIAYRDSSITAAPPSAPGPEQGERLARLHEVLEKYGFPQPLENEPGFRVNAQDCTLTAKLVGERDLDLTVYWAPGNHSKLSLPLVIADIRSRMAETTAGAYSLQPKQYNKEQTNAGLR